MSRRRLGQWRPLSNVDRRWIRRIASGLAEFKGEQLRDKHLMQAQRLLCSKNGPLADRITDTRSEVDVQAMVG
jgi:hypothetical protein